LAWAYGHGFIPLAAVEEGLGNVIAAAGAEQAGEPVSMQDVADAARGALAFLEGRWDEAGTILAPLFAENDEGDGFARWMLLVCAMEKGDDPAALAAYGVIRARYTSFPEYWYRGARAFSGAIGAEYAERCVSLAPDGPFASECRSLLAVFLGLRPIDGDALKSRGEIEAIITASVNRGDPKLLAGLMPLISLPDNTYTVYTVGALQALAASREFREYFAGEARKASGRLAERLSFISRSEI
jgi:hypothetical protein